jgi:hypothetical protein
MAVPFLPVFSAGQILTSANMNQTSDAVNSLGLFFIKSQTIGSGVSSVTVSSAFSSDYEDYFITVTGSSVSANQPNLLFRVGATTSNYNYGGIYLAYSSATVTGDVSTAGSGFVMGACGNGTTGNGVTHMAVTVKQPFVTQATIFNAQNASVNWSSFYNGIMNNGTSYTAFTILPSSGTLTGGTIRVFGYRKSYS